MSKILTLKQAKYKGLDTHSYNNGDYEYEDENGTEHLIRDGKLLCKGVSVRSFDNGDYEYKDKDGIKHYIEKGDK